jgi:hypothetical protein
MHLPLFDLLRERARSAVARIPAAATTSALRSSARIRPLPPVALLAAALCAALFTGETQAQQEPGPGSRPPVDMPDMAELRANGRPAVRAWVAARRAAYASRRADELKELHACFELAAYVHDEAGGEAIDGVVAEMEASLARARGKAKDSRHQARLTANVACVYERLAGNPAAARRLYKEALQIDPKDEVALAGLARMDRDEAIDERKEIEAERQRELEEFWEKQPRSRPPERAPAPGKTTTSTNR